MHHIKDDEVLGKLKFVAKGEPTRKSRYGKTNLDVMLSDEIKAFADYVNYLMKFGNAQSSVPTLGKGQGKGYMNRGGLEINVEKKKKKVEVLKKKRTITVADNILGDQAVELVVSVNIEEHKKREEERRTKARHEALVIDKEVDHEKGSRASREVHILKQIPKGPREGFVHDKEQEQPTAQPHSPSVTVSSHEDVSRYLNENHENVFTDIMSRPVHTKTHTTSLVPIQEENPEVQDDITSADLTSSPPATKTHLPLTKYKKKRLADHEKRINALAQVDHVESIKESVQASVINEVKNQMSKFMPKAVSDLVQPHLERTILDVMKKNPIDLFKSSTTSSDTLSEYELKKKLYDMMFQSKSFNTHEHHYTLYNALKNYMLIDELVAKGETKKRRRKNTGGTSLQKDKALFDSSNYERFADADEPQQQEQEVPTEEFGGQHVNWFKQPNEKNSIKDAPEQSRFNELVDADKDPEEHELQIRSTIIFAKKMKGFLKKDKITRADLE
ncbi:hypothetical protein Tco_1482477 [Tanacetum coccineum]